MKKKLFFVSVCCATLWSPVFAMDPGLQRILDDAEARAAVVQAQIQNHMFCNELTGQNHSQSSAAIRDFIQTVEPPRDVARDLWDTHNAGNQAKHHFK